MCSPLTYSGNQDYLGNGHLVIVRTIAASRVIAAGMIVMHENKEANTEAGDSNICKLDESCEVKNRMSY